MADRDKAKQKKRLKREQKRREHAKREQQRHRTLSWATGPAQCYITADWQKRGMANLMILRESPGGDWAFAGFLVDAYCIGLKDTMAAEDYGPDDFREMINNARDEQEFVAVSLEESRQVVASAIRWSRMHHFRLPKGWEKAASILGGLEENEIAAADVDGFGKDGGLFYHGYRSDLESKLTNQSLQDFLDRPEVEVLFVPEGIDLDDPELMEAMEESLESLSSQIADTVRQWCFRTGRKPEEELEAACGLVTSALMQVQSTGAEQVDLESLRHAVLNMAEQSDREYPEEPPVRPAAGQVMDFVLSKEGQGMLDEVLDRGEEDEDFWPER